MTDPLLAFSRLFFSHEATEAQLPSLEPISGLACDPTQRRKLYTLNGSPNASSTEVQGCFFQSLLSPPSPYLWRQMNGCLLRLLHPKRREVQRVGEMNAHVTTSSPSRSVTETKKRRRSSHGEDRLLPLLSGHQINAKLLNMCFHIRWSGEWTVQLSCTSAFPGESPPWSASTKSTPSVSGSSYASASTTAASTR